MNRYPNRNLSRDQAIPQPLFGCRHPLFCLAMLFCLAGAGTVGAFEQPKVYDLKPKDQILILGDSVTADGQCAAGFVRLIDQAQHEQVPELGVVVRAIGAYGEKLPDFPRGFAYIVEMTKKPNPPTVAIIALGLNDSGAKEKGLPAFTDQMRKAVTQLREAKLTVILCTTTGALAGWRLYSDAVRTVATEMKCPLIDLSAVYIDNVIKHCPKKETQDKIAPEFLPGFDPHRDHCHLNMYGETLSASTFLKAFGLKPVWQKYQIRTSVNRKGHRPYTGEGTIKIEPELPSNGPTPALCGNQTWPLEQQAYAPGTKVTLTVLPAAGNTFNRWYTLEEGTLKETSPSLTITIDRHTWIYAEVKPIEAKKP